MREDRLREGLLLVRVGVEVGRVDAREHDRGRDLDDGLRARRRRRRLRRARRDAGPGRRRRRRLRLLAVDALAVHVRDVRGARLDGRAPVEGPARDVLGPGEAVEQCVVALRPLRTRGVDRGQRAVEQPVAAVREASDAAREAEVHDAAAAARCGRRDGRRGRRGRRRRSGRGRRRRSGRFGVAGR